MEDVVVIVVVAAAGEVGLEDGTAGGVAAGDVFTVIGTVVVLLVSVMMLTFPSRVTLAACIRMEGNS